MSGSTTLMFLMASSIDRYTVHALTTAFSLAILRRFFSRFLFTSSRSSVLMSFHSWEFHDLWMLDTSALPSHTVFSSRSSDRVSPISGYLLTWSSNSSSSALNAFASASFSSSLFACESSIAYASSGSPSNVKGALARKSPRNARTERKKVSKSAFNASTSRVCMGKISSFLRKDFLTTRSHMRGASSKKS